MGDEMRTEEEIKAELKKVEERCAKEKDEIINRLRYENSQITRNMQIENRITLHVIGALKWVLGED